MTKKEMLETIVNGEINEEVIAKAKEMLEKLEVANAKKAAKDWEKRNEKNSAPARRYAKIGITVKFCQNPWLDYMRHVMACT